MHNKYQSAVLYDHLARRAYFRVVVLSRCGVDGAGEHGDLHLGHQRVVDGCVCESRSIRRPPVGDVGLKHLGCEGKI